MELTGKCKEAFEEWFITFIRAEDRIGNRFYDQTLINDFVSMNTSFKFGVYQDFFDSVGIDTCVTPVLPVKTYGYSFSIGLENEYHIYTSRPEARVKAIEKADEIFNLRK